MANSRLLIGVVIAGGLLSTCLSIGIVLLVYCLFFTRTTVQHVDASIAEARSANRLAEVMGGSDATSSTGGTTGNELVLEGQIKYVQVHGAIEFATGQTSGELFFLAGDNAHHIVFNPLCVASGGDANMPDGDGLPLRIGMPPRWFLLHSDATYRIGATSNPEGCQLAGRDTIPLIVNRLEVVRPGKGVSLANMGFRNGSMVHVAKGGVRVAVVDGKLVTSSLGTINSDVPAPWSVDEIVTRPVEDAMRMATPDPAPEEVPKGDLSDLQIPAAGLDDLLSLPGTAPAGTEERGQPAADSAKEVQAPVPSLAALDVKPRVIHQASPVVTKEMSRKLPARVVVVFIVNAKGRVENVRVQQSTDSVFEQPALSAVSKWRFEPGRKDGNPVACRMRVPIVFPKSK